MSEDFDAIGGTPKVLPGTDFRVTDESGRPYFDHTQFPTPVAAPQARQALF